MKGELSVQRQTLLQKIPGWPWHATTAVDATHGAQRKSLEPVLHKSTAWTRLTGEHLEHAVIQWVLLSSNAQGSQVATQSLMDVDFLGDASTRPSSDELRTEVLPTELMEDVLAIEDRVLTDTWEREHDEHVLQELLKVVEVHFTSTTWVAFRRQVFEHQPIDVVADQLGISANAAVIAKSRVIRRLREEAAGLVD